MLWWLHGRWWRGRVSGMVDHEGDEGGRSQCGDLRDEFSRTPGSEQQRRNRGEGKNWYSREVNGAGRIRSTGSLEPIRWLKALRGSGWPKRRFSERGRRGSQRKGGVWLWQRGAGTAGTPEVLVSSWASTAESRPGVPTESTGVSGQTGRISDEGVGSQMCRWRDDGLRWRRGHGGPMRSWALSFGSGIGTALVCASSSQVTRESSPLWSIVARYPCHSRFSERRRRCGMSPSSYKYILVQKLGYSVTVLPCIEDEGYRIQITLKQTVWPHSITTQDEQNGQKYTVIWELNRHRSRKVN